MKTQDANVSEQSQRDLAAGVLKQAAQDLRRFHGATSKVEQEIYLDAYRWLTANECSSPFSFLNVCQLLNVAPDNIRQELIGDLSLGPLSWVRRCGCAVRRFQISFGRIFQSARNTDEAQPGFRDTAYIRRPLLLRIKDQTSLRKEVPV